MPAANQKGALAGIRVVELTSYISGPYAGMLLADFGAEVIKIEPPERGDPFRGWGTRDNPFFRSVNRNKKSVTLDLKSSSGVDTAQRLIEGSDILIENYRTGALDRLGLGYDELRPKNPGLIYCSITGFGDCGPSAHKPGYDTIGQAMGGLLGLLPFTFVYCGLIGPINATAAGLAMRDFGHAAGMASALAGILLYGGGALASMAMGAFVTPKTPVPLTGLMALFGFFGVATYLLFRPRKPG